MAARIQAAVHCVLICLTAAACLALILCGRRMRHALACLGRGIESLWLEKGVERVLCAGLPGNEVARTVHAPHSL